MITINLLLAANSRRLADQWPQYRILLGEMQLFQQAVQAEDMTGAFNDQVDDYARLYRAQTLSPKPGSALR